MSTRDVYECGDAVTSRIHPKFDLSRPLESPLNLTRSNSVKQRTALDLALQLQALDHYLNTAHGSIDNLIDPNRGAFGFGNTLEQQKSYLLLVYGSGYSVDPLKMQEADGQVLRFHHGFVEIRACLARWNTTTLLRTTRSLPGKKAIWCNGRHSSRSKILWPLQC